MGCLGDSRKCGRHRVGAYVELRRVGATWVVPRWSRFIFGVRPLR